MPEQRFVFTAEPTNSDAGKILRAQLSQAKVESRVISSARVMEELFLFMADHADHLASLVLPSLGKGAIVISDRYTDSTAAYQGVTLRGIVPDPVQMDQKHLQSMESAAAHDLALCPGPRRWPCRGCNRAGIRRSSSGSGSCRKWTATSTDWLCKSRSVLCKSTPV